MITKKITALQGWLMLMAAGLLMISCNKQPVGPTGPDPVVPGSYLPISQLRALHSGGADVTVPLGTKKIIGQVISNSANEAVGNFRLQDESGAGIYLYTVQGSPVYNLGDILEVDAAGAGILTLFNGDLELKSVPSPKVVVLNGVSLNVTPRVANVATVIDSMQRWASTLVTINNVTITKTTGNSTGQNYSITDGTGTIVSFVRNASGIVLPEGGAASITGYVSIYQPGTSAPVVQLTVRAATDVVNGGQGGGTGGTGITLNTSPYVIDFNSIAGQLPAGVSVVTGANATTAGTAASLITSPQSSLWNRTSAGFRNYASAAGLHMGSDSVAQVNSANRALGFRQTGSAGDPGAAFVFMINNTTGKSNLKMDFQLQSLDTSSTRTTTWAVDYAVGDSPAAFTALAPTGSMVTGNKTFTDTAISVSLPAAVNNLSQKVWIRVIALTPTTGSGTRASSAIDDVKFTWN